MRTALTCDNSTGVYRNQLRHRVYDVANSNTILFSSLALGDGLVGGYSIANVSLTSNSPGTPLVAFALDTKTAIANVSAGATNLTIHFA